MSQNKSKAPSRKDLEELLTAAGVPWEASLTVPELKLRMEAAEYDIQRMPDEEIAKLTVPVLRHVVAIHGNLDDIAGAVPGSSSGIKATRLVKADYVNAVVAIKRRMGPAPAAPAETSAAAEARGSSSPKPANTLAGLRAQLDAAGILWTEDMRRQDLKLRLITGAIPIHTMSREEMMKLKVEYLQDIMDMHELSLDPFIVRPKKKDYVDEIFKLNEPAYKAETDAISRAPRDIFQNVSRFMGVRDQMRLATALSDRMSVAQTRAKVMPAKFNGQAIPASALASAEALKTWVKGHDTSKPWVLENDITKVEHTISNNGKTVTITSKKDIHGHVKQRIVSNGQGHDNFEFNDYLILNLTIDKDEPYTVGEFKETMEDIHIGMYWLRILGADTFWSWRSGMIEPTKKRFNLLKRLNYPRLTDHIVSYFGHPKEREFNNVWNVWIRRFVSMYNRMPLQYSD